MPRLSPRLTPHSYSLCKAAMTVAEAIGTCPADDGTELEGVAGAASPDHFQAPRYSNFWDGSNIGNLSHSVG